MNNSFSNSDSNSSSFISIFGNTKFKSLSTDHLNFDKLIDETNVINKKIINYGQFIDTIGEGSSSVVSLFKANNNNKGNSRHHHQKFYAIKKFKTTDNQNIINKIKLEFQIGKMLNGHLNFIRTIDLVNDSNDWFLVLEFLPYDFFNLVMNVEMEADEIFCYFKQLVMAVQFMHKMGIAHRDLKLDNCVVNQSGILKIIDFGSAVVFDENREEIVKCHGIVGSDPYLAPELLTNKMYDPRPIDIWSLAIIFYCLIMKKFPWKAPRISFNSYRLFCEDPDDEDDISKGPMRLLNCLPRESQDVIRQMLQLDPSQRFDIQQVAEEPWVQKISCSHAQNTHIHHFTKLDTHIDIEANTLNRKFSL